MPRFTASAARHRLFHLLDSAEKGEEVILERRGVRFRLTLDVTKQGDIPPSPLIIEDPDLLEKDWTWETKEGGELAFRRRE